MVDEWNRARNAGSVESEKKFFFPRRLHPPHTQRRIFDTIYLSYRNVQRNDTANPLQFVTRKNFYRFNTGIHFGEKNILQIFNTYTSCVKILGDGNHTSQYFKITDQKTISVLWTIRQIELKRVQIFKYIAHCNIHIKLRPEMVPKHMRIYRRVLHQVWLLVTASVV